MWLTMRELHTNSISALVTGYTEYHRCWLQNGDVQKLLDDVSVTEIKLVGCRFSHKDVYWHSLLFWVNK